MTKLTDTQLIVLSKAAARDGGAACVPERMTKAAAAKVGSSLIGRKLMREIRSKPRMPIWREDEDGRHISHIIPDDKVGQEAFAVIREAMREKKMVALARVVLAKREHVIMLQPWDKGLMGTALRYPYEIRDSKQLFEDLPDLKVAPEMLKLADHIVESKKGNFDPSQFVDHYEEAVVEMIRRKRAGLPAQPQKISPTAPNVVSLMDALRRSIADEKGAKPPAAAKSAAKKGRKRIAGQTEMLLPIPGKKAKEEAKPVTRSSTRQKKAG